MDINLIKLEAEKCQTAFVMRNIDARTRTTDQRDSYLHSFVSFKEASDIRRVSGDIRGAERLEKLADENRAVAGLFASILYEFRNANLKNDSQSADAIVVSRKSGGLRALLANEKITPEQLEAGNKMAHVVEAVTKILHVSARNPDAFAVISGGRKERGFIPYKAAFFFSRVYKPWYFEVRKNEGQNVVDMVTKVCIDGLSVRRTRGTMRHDKACRLIGECLDKFRVIWMRESKDFDPEDEQDV